jgi:hypothetical protein
MSGHRKHVAMAGLALLAVMWNMAAASAGDRRFPSIDPNGVIRLDPNALSAYVLWQDRQAEEVYRTEGAEIVPWTREAALPNPDNAAVLYYQAFLLRPEPDAATDARINAVLWGAEPDQQIRVYLGNCRAMIHTGETATRIPRCTWGIRHFDTTGFTLGELLPHIRRLGLVLALDARALGADGHYEAALARCLAMRRLARHVGDDTILAYIVSLSTDGLAQRTMQYLLGLLPPNPDVLQRLRGQLAAVPGASESMEQAVQADFDYLLELMRDEPKVLEYVRQNLAKKGGGQWTPEEILGLTDEDILALTREPFQRFLDGVFQVINSDMPYEQKHAEIRRQTSKAREDYGDDPAASQVLFECDGILSCFGMVVRHAAGYNALKAAVEVYLARAPTGQLPQTLPAYTPKDPFSGRDFEYEITADGFILRCRAEDLDASRIQQYEFKIRNSTSPNP